MITQSLKNYIETDILPLYDSFDAAHQRNHVEMVIEQSKTIATDLDVNMDMAYTIHRINGRPQESSPCVGQDCTRRYAAAPLVP